MSYFSKYKGKKIEDVLDDSVKHVADVNNPHKVTASQLGLDDVVHIKTIKSVSYDGAVDGQAVTKLRQEVAAMSERITTTQQSVTSGINSESQRAQRELADHTGNKNNPHEVTAEQLGLSDAIHSKTVKTVEYDGSVDGQAVAKLRQEVAAMGDRITTTQQSVTSGINSEAERAKKELSDHAGNKENPHGVTAEQIGLGDAIHAKVVSSIQYDGAVDGQAVAKLRLELAAETERAKTAETSNVANINALAQKVSYYKTIQTL